MREEKKKRPWRENTSNKIKTVMMFLFEKEKTRKQKEKAVADGCVKI